jgi:DNA-binding NarL/FixJ family response regulator
MAKHQVNVRISDLTRDKLDFLSEYYGTQAEAMAVAIDRLYRETRYGYGDDALPGKEASDGKHKSDDAMLSDLAEERIRVLIVDDEPHVRENIMKLALTLGVEVAGAAATGKEGIELAKKLQPHIVLMDRLMPGMDGLAASQAITKQVPFTRIIMTAVQGAESLRRSMLAGARDCLSRPFNQYELWHSIRRVYDMAPYPQPAAQERALSKDELTGLREAVQAMEYVRDLLSKHPELAGDEGS